MSDSFSGAFVMSGSFSSLNYVRKRGTAQFFLEPLGNDLNLQMMLIPAGTFLMGSPEDELERLDNEGPQHEVSIPAFFMGKYPVTQAQWRFVASLPTIQRDLKPDPSHFKGELNPVESISWFEAVEFCNRLAIFTKQTYRLPSEAEWEYACRAGTTTPFHFGETITTDLANYCGTDSERLNWSGSYGRGPKGSYRETTTPVDGFGIANAFGLCDMHGNVYEWCRDEWHNNYEGAPTDGSAWIARGDTRNEDVSLILRGGSWAYNPEICRSASRFTLPPHDYNYLLGFRVVYSALRVLS